jgi:hypothetical protein
VSSGRIVERRGAGAEGGGVGNRSKRRRRDPDAPDPTVEWQEESQWSGYTRHIRFPFVAGRGTGWPTRSSMPDAAQWLGITVVVLGVLGGVWLLFWLLSLIVS